MEIRFTNYGGETTSASSWAVRVPVARGAENAAARIFEQQRERLAVYSPPAKPQNYRLKRNIAIGVAFVSAAAFGMAMLLAKKCPPGWQIAVMVTAITGALLCPAALLCAAVWHWSDKSE